MKTIIILIASLFTVGAMATVDVQGEATIVVEEVQESGSYFLRTVPTEYCVGIDSYALATAITQPVMIKTNYGCGHSGDMIGEAQVNAATCAVISANEENNADGSYNPRTVSIKVDLSKCGAKASNNNFVRAVENAVHNSFNANRYQVVRYTHEKAK